MPVESRDDLARRLREKVTSDHSRGCQGREYTCDCGYDISIEGFLELAATRIEADAKRIAELEAENADLRCWVATYSSNANEERSRADSAERALAEERERHQWRTIESAPTNGDPFLAWEGSERGPFKCWWRDDWPYDESCWMDAQDTEPQPTHWKLLDIPDATAIRSGKPDGKE